MNPDAGNALLEAERMMEAFLKYCQRDDAQLRQWLAEYEDSWGTRMQELVTGRYSPNLSSQYPALLQQQPQQPAAQKQPSHPLPPPQQQQQQHRRLAEVRNPPISGARPSPHQHDSSFSRASSGSSSPTLLVGRPLEDLRLHNNPGPSKGNQTRGAPAPSHLKSSHSDTARGHPGPGSSGGSMGVGQGGINGVGVKREREQEGKGVSNAPHARRAVHDAGIDLILQDAGNGGRSGENGGAYGQSRGAGSSGDGPQSLPSLKSVGLLAVQHQVTMPVGLQWLANESR
ncbi:hypothetical protein H0H81_011890 [Sphagnurus paluster]|uniref:Uncharacterized protein n=1 Tax=Sphagnurus paluster TaxID=117069 RepID=A0A9P7K3T8_9AGAR|nr:hypothetical protein H0H81_011890 [Sphagnurus paluster]